jgi:hypothetical protein
MESPSGSESFALTTRLVEAPCTVYESFTATGGEFGKLVARDLRMYAGAATRRKTNPKRISSSRVPGILISPCRQGKLSKIEFERFVLLYECELCIKRLTLCPPLVKFSSVF